MHDSSLGRIVGVLVAPEATFRSIAARPSWLVVWLVILAVGLGVAGAVVSSVDFREVAERTLERRDTPLTEEQRESSVEMQEKVLPYSIPIGTVVWTLLLLLFAVFYWGALHLVGSDIDYRRTLSTYLYASVPAYVVGGLIALIVILGRGEVTPEELETRSFLASNLTVFAPADASPVLLAALGSFDFFVLWTAVLLVLGLRAVAQVSTASAVGLVAIFFLLRLGLVTGMAALGSAFG